MNNTLIKSTVAACLVTAASASFAHVVLGTDTARAGSYFRADFRVGHGCAGSPTTAVTVFVPKGVLVAKPQPKSGWTVETQIGQLDTPGKVHGREVREAVERVRWSGGRLPDDHFDEFSLLLRVPDSAGTLDFRVLQQCETGEMDWSQGPGDGSGGARARYPMPRLRVLPPAEQGHRH